MRIAVLGATSEIAKDLILAFYKDKQHSLVLFARRPDDVQQWIDTVIPTSQFECFNFDVFHSQGYYDAIINFVGVGNPAKTAALGAGIFDITLRFDGLALDYVERNPTCKYIFLSSGAAYCSDFLEPANECTKATIDLNNLQPHDWYGVAKLHAECRHRALPHLSIVDVRVFNYFSHTQDMNARFLITDILRSIRDKTVFETSSSNITRDFIHPSDFYQLISLILAANHINLAVDCYSKNPISKHDLLEAMKIDFGLMYKTNQDNQDNQAFNANGNKINYYSKYTQAAQSFLYQPSYSSKNTLIEQTHLSLNL
jgi:nucleoside-diphosphate-sugar epimerase